jgi:RHS repeat-associated protein
MSGISSKTLNFGKENNLQRFNSAELNNDFDLNQYEFFFRNYNPQIGRWQGLDTKPKEMISLYAAMENNPIVNVDFLGDTTIYYAYGTNRILRQINNEGAIEHIQVNEILANAFHVLFNVLNSGMDADEADLSDQEVANQYVTQLNGTLDNAEAIYGDMLESVGYGRDVITRATGALSLSFEGHANSENRNEANGTLYIRRHFDNGTNVNIAEYTAIGGPYGNGSPENGNYYANTARRRGDNPGMIREGVGFSLNLNPMFNTGRSLLRIHPDGNRAGTQGCIGLQVNSTQLTNFYNTMRNYLQTHPQIAVNVNIQGNPNNNGRGNRVNNNGE